MDFQSARHWAAEYVEATLTPGAHAIDATMGNGHDTLWLCGLLGENGLVYAFDLQSAALENTKRRLADAGMSSRARLFLTGHEHMAEVVFEPVDAVVFNLGWLPGAAHALTTRTESTLLAVNSAISLLSPGGIVTICVYPGHPEGMRERESLVAWAASLDPKRFDVLHKRYLNQPNHPPELLAVRKRPK